MSRELKAQAAAELAELERAEGRLMRASIVAKAKDKASALHQYFEWDKTKAAQSHWLQTAGEIIRAYKVWVTVSGSEQPQQVRAFVSLSTDRVNGGGYRSLATVMDDDDMRETMLADAIRDLEIFQRKYSILSELRSVFVEIEKVVRRSRASKPSEQRASA
jgi:hypothetical protein